VKRLLMLDYDGTLTPIRKHPKLAVLSPKRRYFLRQLAGRPGNKLAIISGRKLSDIKRLVGIKNIIYVGNHGFEIEAGGKYWIHPAAKRFSLLLKKIKRALKNGLSYRQIFIEDKGLTLSVHYRCLAGKRLPAFKKAFFRAVKPWQDRLMLTHGKKVFELRPPVDWDKGKAVNWLIGRPGQKDYFPVYIGDDRTDEDAFRALKGKGLALKVGPGGKTLAAKRLRDVAAVYRFLLYLSVGRC